MRTAESVLMPPSPSEDRTSRSIFVNTNGYSRRSILLMRSRRYLNNETFLIGLAVLMIVLSGQLFCATTVLAKYPLLKSLIIAYNAEVREDRVRNGGPYRGEEGILNIRPEIARSFGMKVFIDRDYLDSRALFQKADKYLKRAEMAMVSQKKEKFPGEHVQTVFDNFLLSKKSVELADYKLKAYRSRLKPGVDERFNKALSRTVLDRLLAETLNETDNQLRDALGFFYNMCQGKDENKSPLTPENVKFVNKVFHQFVEQASEETLNSFDLDRDNGNGKRDSAYDLRALLARRYSKYIPFVQAVLKKYKGKIYAIDPLLFISLIRAESNFDPLLISRVGAAGLTQIMPKTARELGMKNIYMPAYLEKATTLLEQERKARREARATLHQITQEKKVYLATKARGLMQRALALARKKESLFTRYKMELLRQRTDDRLRPALAIEYGFKYFASMMKKQNGDISLALASYNAGPHRVRKFEGIPPYAETVHFRNRILKYYRDYLRKAARTSPAQ
jgi:soluble lytic murein transglycosylase-like protein